MCFLTPEPAHPAANDARLALLAKGAELMLDHGRPSVVVIAEDDEVPLLEPLGFKSHGRAAEWTFHKSLVRTWDSLARVLFERVLPKKSPTTKGDLAA